MTIPAGQVIHVKAITSVTGHSRWVNVTTSPINNDYGNCVVPTYSFLNPGYKRIPIILRNISCQDVILKKGSRVAEEKQQILYHIC